MAREALGPGDGPRAALEQKHLAEEEERRGEPHAGDDEEAERDGDRGDGDEPREREAREGDRGGDEDVAGADPVLEDEPRGEHRERDLGEERDRQRDAPGGRPPEELAGGEHHGERRDQHDEPDLRVGPRLDDEEAQGKVEHVDDGAIAEGHAGVLAIHARSRVRPARRT